MQQQQQQQRKGARSLSSRQVTYRLAFASDNCCVLETRAAGCWLLTVCTPAVSLEYVLGTPGGGFVWLRMSSLLQKLFFLRVSAGNCKVT